MHKGKSEPKVTGFQEFHKAARRISQKHNLRTRNTVTTKSVNSGRGSIWSFEVGLRLYKVFAEGRKEGQNRSIDRRHRLQHKQTSQQNSE